jgi:hypothetical protein
VVLRESDLDPEHGRHDRWLCRGIVDGRSIIRSGLRSESSACRAAWFVYDDACEIGLEAKVDNVVDADIAVAEARGGRAASARVLHRAAGLMGPHGGGLARTDRGRRREHPPGQ